jgi:8-amino-3,8-dideoxy-alpha-D-manno-octulosonate transaminase
MPGYELIGKEERKAINEIFDTKSLFYNGERVKLFERQFADYIGVDYAVAVSSGTAALKTALITAGIKPGDEVITQAFTFIATVEAIVDVGATPIIVNIDETLNMDVVEFQKAITPKTKAVIPVDMLGVATEVDLINVIAKENNLIVIDDCCEALGADWGEEKLGAQFDMCTFSFDNGKTITTGEGGMITTNNEEYYKLCLEYRDHGHENNPNYARGCDTHRIHGFNFRTTEINAAIGIEQLKKLDYIVERNRINYKIYEDSLKDLQGISIRRIPEKCNPLCDCLIFNFPKSEHAQQFVKLISEKGLSTKNIPDAIEWHFARHWDHIFNKYGLSKSDLHKLTKNSADILDRSVAIPVMVNLEDEIVLKNSDILRKAANEVLVNVD